MKSSNKTIFWAALFAVAMAYLESAVVVYLRLIYYPNGFDFPLTAAPIHTILIELGREAATIIMLVTVGIFCGRSPIERFAYLLFCFGVWDIMYYGWLKIFIGWPAALSTWDILFLIPLPWIGPVLAPVLVSLIMIWAAIRIIKLQDKGVSVRFSRTAWLLEILAGLIIIASFVWDVRHVIKGGYPLPFHWEIFGAGLVLGIIVFQVQMNLPHQRDSHA
ncbi:MAG: hypothetical protein NTW14_12930 [bacterium]|nr:hypothetical protein [bacterium]